MQPFARLYQLCLESAPSLSTTNNCTITFAKSGVTAQDSKYSAVLEKKVHWRGVFVHNGELFIILALCKHTNSDNGTLCGDKYIVMGGFRKLRKKSV